MASGTTGKNYVYKVELDDPNTHSDYLCMNVCTNGSQDCLKFGVIHAFLQPQSEWKILADVHLFQMPDDVAYPISTSSTQDTSLTMYEMVDMFLVNLQSTQTLSSNVPTDAPVKQYATRWCGICSTFSRRIPLQLCQINFEEALYLCVQENCQYPLLDPNLQDFIVQRDVTQLMQLSRLKQNKGHLSSRSYGLVCSESVNSKDANRKNLKPLVAENSTLGMLNLFPENITPIKENISHKCISKNTESPSVNYENVDTWPLSAVSIVGSPHNSPETYPQNDIVDLEADLSLSDSSYQSMSPPDQHKVPEDSTVMKESADYSLLPLHKEKHFKVDSLVGRPTIETPIFHNNSTYQEIGQPTKKHYLEQSNTDLEPMKNSEASKQVEKRGITLSGSPYRSDRSENSDKEVSLKDNVISNKESVLNQCSMANLESIKKTTATATATTISAACNLTMSTIEDSQSPPTDCTITHPADKSKAFPENYVSDINKEDMSPLNNKIVIINKQIGDNETTQETSFPFLKSVETQPVGWPPRCHEMLQWQNSSNSCWLDVLLKCIVNVPTIRSALNLLGTRAPNIFSRLCNVYDNSQQAATTTNDRRSSILNLELARNDILNFMISRFQLKSGQHESAVEMFSNLLKMDSSLSPLFSVSMRWQMECNECGHKESRRLKTEIVSFLHRTPNFHPMNAVSERPCPACSSEGQQYCMLMEEIPSCVMMYFQKGLSHNRFGMLDFGVNSNLFSVCAVIQYITDPINHFIVWIRDCKANKWMCCDDLKSPVCHWQSKAPKIKPIEIHMIMWEKQGLQYDEVTEDNSEHIRQHLQVVQNSDAVLSDDESIKTQDDIETIVVDDDIEECAVQPAKTNVQVTKDGGLECEYISNDLIKLVNSETHPEKYTHCDETLRQSKRPFELDCIENDLSKSAESDSSEDLPLSSLKRKWSRKSRSSEDLTTQKNVCLSQPAQQTPSNLSFAMIPANPVESTTTAEAPSTEQLLESSLKSTEESTSPRTVMLRDCNNPICQPTVVVQDVVRSLRKRRAQTPNQRRRSKRKRLASLSSDSDECSVNNKTTKQQKQSDNSVDDPSLKNEPSKDCKHSSSDIASPKVNFHPTDVITLDDSDDSCDDALDKSKDMGLKSPIPVLPKNGKKDDLRTKIAAKLKGSTLDVSALFKQSLKLPGSPSGLLPLPPKIRLPARNVQELPLKSKIALLSSAVDKSAVSQDVATIHMQPSSLPFTSVLPTTGDTLMAVVKTSPTNFQEPPTLVYRPLPARVPTASFATLAPKFEPAKQFAAVDFRKLPVSRPKQKQKSLGPASMFESYKPKRAFKLAGYEKKSASRLKARNNHKDGAKSNLRGSRPASYESSDKSSEISEVADLFPDFDALSSFSETSAGSTIGSSSFTGGTSHNQSSSNAKTVSSQNSTSTPSLPFQHNGTGTASLSSYTTSTGSQPLVFDEFMDNLESNASSSMGEISSLPTTSNNSVADEDESTFDFFSLLDL